MMFTRISHRTNTLHPLLTPSELKEAFRLYVLYTRHLLNKENGHVHRRGTPSAYQRWLSNRPS